MCQIPDLRRVEPKHNIESDRNVRGQTFSNKTVIYASMVIKNVRFHMWVPEKKESCHMKVVTSTRSRDLAPQYFFTVGPNEDNGMHEQVSHHGLCQRKHSTKDCSHYCDNVRWCIVQSGASGIVAHDHPVVCITFACSTKGSFANAFLAHTHAPSQLFAIF